MKFGLCVLGSGDSIIVFTAQENQKRFEKSISSVSDLVGDRDISAATPTLLLYSTLALSSSLSSGNSSAFL